MGGNILDFSLLMSTTVDGMELSLGEHRSYGCMCRTRVHSLLRTHSCMVMHLVMLR
jgi:hypothetical protein